MGKSNKRTIEVSQDAYVFFQVGIEILSKHHGIKMDMAAYIDYLITQQQDALRFMFQCSKAVKEHEQTEVARLNYLQNLKG